ncbi:MAG TPA: endonuclease III [archaeon]|nr:endonuclease III [archaeon]
MTVCLIFATEKRGILLETRKYKAEIVLDRLSRIYKVSWRPSRDDFDILVSTVLSQNTNRENTQRAFSRLKEKVKSFDELSKIDEKKLQNLVKPAGLYHVKAKRLKGLAKIIMERYNGSLDSILNKSPERARKDLLSLEGVGPKTADIILLFKKGEPVIPVDTHIFLISKRLELAPAEADYEGVKRALEKGIPFKKRENAHLVLIAFGRDTCRARSPKCPVCPVKDLCNWWKGKVDVP